jgi:predicted glutamine amidotransferase
MLESRLVGYLGNDPERVTCALFPARNVLAPEDGGGMGGWGLGFVQGGDVLLQKRPRSDGADVDFFSIAKDLRADAFVGRVRATTGQPLAAEDADPFRFRSWLFASLGEVIGFDKVRAQLLDSVPAFLLRNIRGQSASEHLFHLFLAFLHDGGQLEHAAAPLDAVRRALEESVALLDRRLTESHLPPARLALLASNGRCLVAFTSGPRLAFLEIAGIAECAVCTQRAEIENDHRVTSHNDLRAVVIEADGHASARAGWQTVPPGHTLLVELGRTPRIVAADR